MGTCVPSTDFLHDSHQLKSQVSGQKGRKVNLQHSKKGCCYHVVKNSKKVQDVVIRQQLYTSSEDGMPSNINDEIMFPSPSWRMMKASYQYCINCIVLRPQFHKDAGCIGPEGKYIANMHTCKRLCSMQLSYTVLNIDVPLLIMTISLLSHLH